jgi:hypothetical protein
MKRQVVLIVSVVVLAGTVAVPTFYLIAPALFWSVDPGPE